MSKELTPFEAVGAVGHAVTSFLDVYKEARINKKFDKIYMATALQHYQEVLRIASENQLAQMRVSAGMQLAQVRLEAESQLMQMRFNTAIQLSRGVIEEILKTEEMIHRQNPDSTGYRMAMEYLELLNGQLQRLLTKFLDAY